MDLSTKRTETNKMKKECKSCKGAGFKEHGYYMVKKSCGYCKGTGIKHKPVKYNHATVSKKAIPGSEQTGWIYLSSGKIEFNADIDALYDQFVKEHKISRDDLYIKTEIKTYRKLAA